MTIKPKVLAVDDEEFNLDIITEYLSDDGYEVIPAEDGVIALEQLEKHPDVDVIVLDRMMPNMNGMQVLEHIKNDSRFRDIPVVMQTAAASTEQVQEGIRAGVYYYLTKPYEERLLVSIVRSALNDSINKRDLKEKVKKFSQSLGMMKQSCFSFRTLQEAKNLSYLIANCFPDPERTVYGLNEIFINSIEHGNLGISYQDKSRLMLEGKWLEEVEKRLNMSEYKDKVSHFFYEVRDDSIVVRVKDDGNGFDWKKYLELGPERATDLHGRGIATSKLVSFDKMEYVGKGNEVICSVYLN